MEIECVVAVALSGLNLLIVGWLAWMARTHLFIGDSEEIDDEIEAVMNQLAGALAHLIERTDTLIEMVPNVNLHHHANPLEPIIRAFAEKMAGGRLDGEVSSTAAGPRDERGRYIGTKEEEERNP
jgi:type II secretory pathway component PulJ